VENPELDPNNSILWTEQSALMPKSGPVCLSDHSVLLPSILIVKNGIHDGGKRCGLIVLIVMASGMALGRDRTRN